MIKFKILLKKTKNFIKNTKNWKIITKKCNSYYL